jgi:AraC-like DNA-binding protein
VQAKKGTDSVRQLDAVSSAVNFMENNYFRPIDVSTIASEMGISRSHFTTLFTSAMGLSPYNYLLKLRIAKAEKLLIERPSLTVTEVAYSVGFSGVERFSEMFKKYTGFSPLVYRKKKGENL